MPGLHLDLVPGNMAGWRRRTRKSRMRKSTMCLVHDAVVQKGGCYAAAALPLASCLPLLTLLPNVPLIVARERSVVI